MRPVTETGAVTAMNIFSFCYKGVFVLSKYLFFPSLIHLSYNIRCINFT